MTLDELAALPARVEALEVGLTGRVLALEQALSRRQNARRVHESAAVKTMLWAPELTDTETTLLPYLAAGWTNRQIGRRLAISERTVRTHVTNVLTKFQAENRTTVGLWALATGAVSLGLAVELMAQQQPHLVAGADEET